MKTYDGYPACSNIAHHPHWVLSSHRMYPIKCKQCGMCVILSKRMQAFADTVFKLGAMLIADGAASRVSKL